ncbi:MAG: hypothetical protein Q4P20_08435 [Eubacteriales bacterium]|nr:hypothetical protein [Eubacteriales bacterium]
MKPKQWHLMEAVAFFQSQGAPGDQQALTELFWEVQQNKGGIIPQKSIEKISHAYDVKKSFLREAVRQTPGLRLAEDMHELEVCGKKSSLKHGGDDLISFIEQAYAVTDGGFSVQGGFRYSVSHRLHGKGAVIRWDGTTYSHATPELIKALVQGEAVAAK